MSRRIATIDLGTNTILLLVVELEDDGAFRVLTDRAEIARLGEGVDRTRSLSAPGVERALEVLREYLHTCRNLAVDEIAAAGTSALRDALNAKSFRARLKHELHLDIRVLSGREEAAYSYLAVQKGLHIDARDVLVVDVGGGSTEFIWASAGKMHGLASLDLGSVRLTERYLRSDPARQEECERVIQVVDQSINKLLSDWGSLRPFENLMVVSQVEPQARGDAGRLAMVGIAGTFTTLSAVEKGLRHYSHGEVHGSRLSRAEVERQVELYRGKTIAERKEIAGLEPKRADVILAGALAIERIMRLFGIDEVIVSDQGIRYGLLYERIAHSHQRSAISKKNN
ncbi:MAG TPA: Ppx/GppA phosphatase family protein [Candidatus Binatia bacterium]|jgi:exopolyphosphatase/guanosine-5'-triphosphate,3'-diphosphate pyrophosphatase